MRKKSSCRRRLPKGERTGRVRVRRDRPAGPVWALALAIAMLMVYLATVVTEGGPAAESAFATPRITRAVRLEGIDMYLVCLASCETDAQARLLASGCTDRGAAGYIYESADGWQVVGAVCREERDAQRMVGRLQAAQAPDARVTGVSAPGTDMRITGPEILIDAIVEADALLRQQAAAMGDMAGQLERGEIGTGVVSTLCAVAATRAHACAEILEKIPEAGENGLSAGLSARLEAMGRLLDVIGGSGAAEGPTVLSGMLRCVQADVVTGHAALLRSLSSS